MKQPVVGHPNPLKAPETGAIVNQDDPERSRSRLAKNQAKMNQRNSGELEALRNDIDEINRLLQQLLNQ